jgi:hypothetical protein
LRSPRVVDPDAAEHVAYSPDGDDEDGLHQPVAHDHPEQVADVARRERIEVDAPEDRRQRDDDDRTVELGHEHGGGGVRERHPLVALVRPRRDMPAALSLARRGQML